MTDLAALQAAVVAERMRRGFTTKPERLVLLMTEELGEVAREVKRGWSVNYDGLDTGRLANEVSDVFVLLLALAATFDIDVEEAVDRKFFGLDSARTWRSADMNRDS